jgi:hypothetical protein
MTPDPAAVAAVADGLSAKQREAVASGFSDEWQAGPNLPGRLLSAIKPLEALRLVERQFGDEGPPVHSERGSELFVKLSACWFFRLTPLGLSVRRHLEGTDQ